MVARGKGLSLPHLQPLGLMPGKGGRRIWNKWAGITFRDPPPNTETSKNLNDVIKIHPKVQLFVQKWFLCLNSKLWEKLPWWLFPQVGMNIQAGSFLCFAGLAGGVLGRGSDHSWTTSKLNLLPEGMLKSDNPVDLPLTKPDSNTIPKSQTPLPLPERHISLVTWYSLWSGKEPLNASPELLRLEGLWLLSSAGPPCSVIPFSPPSAPFTLSSSPGRFFFFF